MDPRFKDQYLQDKEERLASITIECMEHYELIHPISSETKKYELLKGDPPPAKRLKGLAAVLQQIEEQEGHASFPNVLTPQEQIDKEIKSYLDFPAVDS